MMAQQSTEILYFHTTTILPPLTGAPKHWSLIIVVLPLAISLLVNRQSVRRKRLCRKCRTRGPSG